MAGGARTTTGPWEEQKPYLTAGFEEAGRLYGQGQPDYYPGATLAGFDPSQTAAQQSTLGYAMGPRVGALQDAAQQVTLGQMQGATPFTGGQMGDLLAGNVNYGAGTPFGAMADVYREQAENQMQQGLANVRQGMVGSINAPVQPGGGSRGDLAQERVLGQGQKAIAQNLAQMYGGAYQQAQGMRFPAAEMRLGQQQTGQAAYPSIMGAPLEMYGAVGDVGAQRRAMSQEAINQAQQKYQYGAGKEMNALQQYMANISGDYGGTTTQQPSALQSMGQIANIMSAFA
jgi:hypothetical protein